MPDSHFLDSLLHLDITINMNVNPVIAANSVPNVAPMTADFPAMPTDPDPPVVPIEAGITTDSLGCQGCICAVCSHHVTSHCAPNSKCLYLTDYQVF